MPAWWGGWLPRESPGATGTGNTYGGGHVASAGIPAMQKAAVATPAADAVPHYTQLEVLSKPPVQYTAEARQLRVQGDVVLRVTFTANGQVVIQGIVHGLGHGLDEEARKVAQQIRFRPATRNGQPVDLDNEHHHHVPIGLTSAEKGIRLDSAADCRNNASRRERPGAGA